MLFFYPPLQYSYFSVGGPLLFTYSKLDQIRRYTFLIFPGRNPRCPMGDRIENCFSSSLCLELAIVSFRDYF